MYSKLSMPLNDLVRVLVAELDKLSCPQILGRRKLSGKKEVKIAL